MATGGNEANVVKEPGTPLAPSTEVSRVSVRMPPFWPSKPALWFAQVEGSFNISNITTDVTKFYYVVSQLEPQIAAEVEDIIISPPSSNKYEMLKSELIKRLSKSKENKVKQLLLHEELGDRKPSQFLRHLRHLAGEDVPQDFLKTVWSSRLPSNIETVVASQPTLDLQALADLADRVHDIAAPQHQVASMTSKASSFTMEEMARQISELTKSVQRLSRSDNRSRPRERFNRKRSTSRSQSSYRKYPTCWYHSKFGPKANWCIKPCDYKQSENSRGSQ